MSLFKQKDLRNTLRPSEIYISAHNIYKVTLGIRRNNSDDFFLSERRTSPCNSVKDPRVICLNT